MSRTIHISTGGDVFVMPCKGKLQLFEMHSFCGPMPCNKDFSECMAPPKDFYRQCDLWFKGGKRTEQTDQGVLCVVPANCRDCGGTGNLIEMHGRNMGIIKGDCQTCAGTGLEFPSVGQEVQA